LPIIIRDSTILQENIYTLSSVSQRTANQKSTKIGEPLTKNLQKLENHRLSCQSFSEILRISENVWPETHKKLKELSKIKGASLKFKTTSGSHSGLDTSIQPKKQAQKSHATVPLKKILKSLESIGNC
jgi:hypothetical protein